MNGKNRTVLLLNGTSDFFSNPNTTANPQLINKTKNADGNGNNPLQLGIKGNVNPINHAALTSAPPHPPKLNSNKETIKTKTKFPAINTVS